MNTAPKIEPRDAAHPPDDDHGQELDTQDKGKMFRGDHLQETNPESAGYTGIKGTDGKGTQFVSQEIDADNFGRQVTVADGHKGPTHAGPNQISSIGHGDDDKKEGDPIELFFRGKNKSCRSEATEYEYR